MTDIVERLKRVGAERQRTTAHDDPDHYLHVVAKISNADGQMMLEAADEIERLRDVLKNVQHSRVLQGKAISETTAEIERLRTDSQKAALDYLGQIGQLSDEITRLRAALRDAYEVYAGSDGFIPETAAEGYQQQIIRQMVDCISAALEDTEAKRMERSDND